MNKMNILFTTDSEGPKDNIVMRLPKPLWQELALTVLHVESMFLFNTFPFLESILL